MVGNVLAYSALKDLISSLSSSLRSPQGALLQSLELSSFITCQQLQIESEQSRYNSLLATSMIRFGQFIKVAFGSDHKIGMNKNLHCILTFYIERLEMPIMYR